MSTCDVTAQVKITGQYETLEIRQRTFSTRASSPPLKSSEPSAIRTGVAADKWQTNEYSLEMLLPKDGATQLCSCPLLQERP